MFLGIACVLLPIRTCIKKCFKTSEDENDKTAYLDKVLQFTDDYDVANPLTPKKGKLRLIDIKISRLEKSGGEDGAGQLQMLRA